MKAKWQLLSGLPGRRGRHYRAKLARHQFDNALDECAGMTHIDLGANVGEVTRQMAAAGGRVIAFEPDPWTAGRLRANVADLDNVVVEAAAAGIEAGTARLYRHPEFDETGSRSDWATTCPDKSGAEDASAVDVEQVDFPVYLARAAPIGIPKMDIEGAEFDLLERLFDWPGLPRAVRFIFAETHEDRMPGYAERAAALRRRARKFRRPRVNLDWP